MTPRDPKPPLRVVTSLQDAEREPPLRPGGLMMVCAPAEAHRRLQELQAFVRSAMVEGVDFMIIPGTGDKRPCLLQPGAQKLAEIYGFAHRYLYTAEVYDWQGGFFYFGVKCVLTSRADGGFVGEGIGSANSKESKYAQRWVQAKELPAWVNLSTLPVKERPSKFAGGKPYEVYLQPNEDPFSIVNTLQKMATKRSYVHAVVSVTRSSGLFTQDREDLPPDVYGHVEEERSWERQAAPVAPASPSVPDAAPAPVVHRAEVVKSSSNAYAPSEQKAMKELDPALKAATTPEEVEVLRKQAVLAAPIDPADPRKRKPTPRYWDWYQSAIRAAQIRVGGGA